MDTRHNVRQSSRAIAVADDVSPSAVTAAHVVGGRARFALSVKARLGHGRFRDWLRAEFEWSLQTAKRFMNVAKVFQKQQIVDFIAPSALYLLAAPSTPSPARDEALARVVLQKQFESRRSSSITADYATTPKI